LDRASLISSSLHQDFDSLASAIQNKNKDQALRFFKQACPKLDRFLDVTEYIAQNVVQLPALQAELREAIQSSRIEFESIKATIQNAILTNNLNQIIPTLSKAKESIQKLQQASQSAVAGISTASDEKTMIQEEDIPVVSLQTAAKKVETATKFLVVDETSKGRLFGLAKLIAAEMQKMSQAGETKMKKELIETSRNIANIVNNVLIVAREVVQNCSDRRIVNELISFAQAAKNCSVVSKILIIIILFV
jgi:hypothetical protein